MLAASFASSSHRITLYCDSTISMCHWTCLELASHTVATMNLWDIYNQLLMSANEEPAFDPNDQEEAYLALLLPDAPPITVIECIDVHMLSVFVLMKNEDKESLVLSSPLITRRFARHAECRSFTGMAIVMTFCGKILREGKTATVQEVFEYFQNKYEEPFFYDQDDCDMTIRETSMLLGVSRLSMGVLA